MAQPDSLLAKLFLGVFTLLSSVAIGHSAEATEAARLALFNSRVLPLLKANCYECHSHASGKAKGGLMLDSRAGWSRGGGHGPVVVPGEPEQSRLLKAISYEDEDLQMPPKKRLSTEEVAMFRKWIEDGAIDPRVAVARTEVSDHWSFQPVRNPSVPKAGSDWAWSEVDRFVHGRLHAAGLAPVGDAAARPVIRRLHFDLIGLPPTPAAMDRWSVAFDRDPRAAAVTLADELMATPQFGERWARHWLDTARYAESNGNNRNRVFRYAWRYRNWVIDAVNADLPYDRFLKEQLAGDLMPAVSAEARKRQRIATGFLAIGPKPYFPTIVPLDPEEPDRAKYDWAAEQIDAVMSGMMGLTVGCARCHDHKTDPIPTRDYYALAGIFRSTEPRFGMWHHLFGVDEGQAQRDFLYDWNLLVLNDEILDQIKALQARYQPLVIEENQLNLRQRHWPEQIRRMEERLARGKGLNGDLVASLQKNIAERSSQLAQDAKRLPELQRLKQQMRDAFAFSVDQAMGVEDSTAPQHVHLRIKGEHAQRGPLVERGFLTTLPFAGAPTSINARQSGRLELAEWIAHPNNPLTARVAVNRVWYHLFGRGLVETLDNLGVSGERPTHPDLLDHLAHKFIHEFKWSQKSLIRHLLATRIYQLESGETEATPAHFEKDPENKLYWRTSPRRVEAEVIRDSMLAVSGRLDPARPKGSLLTGFEYHADIVHPDRMKALAELNEDHRTIYVPTLRGHRHRLYDLFDYPDDEAVNSARTITTVPTQALFLMNNPLVMNLARSLVQRVSAQPEADRLNELYRLCYGRLPTAAEIRSDQSFLQQQGDQAWERLAHSFLISGEFLFRL